MTLKTKQGEVMDIHPEAVKLLNKHRGTDFRPGGEHYVENLTATQAISQALFERDEARDEHKFVLAAESAAIDTLKAERDTLRAQVAAMREALEPFADEGAEIGDGVPDDVGLHYKGIPEYGETDITVADFRRATKTLSTLKDQSNDA